MTIPRSGSGRQYGYGYTGKKKELTDEERKLLKGTVVPIKKASAKNWRKDPNMRNKAGGKGVIAPNISKLKIKKA